MRVLLVDDEYYILEYLKHLVNWQDYGFNEVIVTSDSEEAEEILLKRSIDLMIADISMPEVTGLDLLEFVAEHQLNTYTALLSGYSEFSYAQKAIGFGVKEYLLKPITKAKLQEFLDRITTMLQEQEHATQEVSNRLAVLLEQLTGYAPSNMYVPDEEVCFFSCDDAMDINQFDGLIDEKNKQGLIKRTLAEQSPAIFDRLSENFLLQNRTRLNQVFYQFFYGLNTSRHPLSEAVEDFFEKYQNSSLPTQSKEQLWATLDESQRIYFLIHIYAFLYFYSAEFNVASANIFSISVSNKKGLFEQFDGYLKSNTDGYSIQEIIDNTNHYIQENLGEKLTLESLADRVYLNAAYFSTLYKQETGQNLSSYILDCRLNKAKDLLINTKLKIADVGNLVGYSNTQYFDRLFKAKYNATPKQFRRKQVSE